MSRVYGLSSWFCTSVAIALAVLVPLTVPEDALADSGTCAALCAYAGNPSTCLEICNAGGCGPFCSQYSTNYSQCIQDCAGPAGFACYGYCNNDYPYDSTCGTNCCQAACGGDQGCVQLCNAFLLSQCPNAYDGSGHYIGCQDAGHPCIVSGKAGTCKPLDTSDNCDCVAAGP